MEQWVHGYTYLQKRRWDHGAVPRAIARCSRFCYWRGAWELQINVQV